MWKNRDPHLRTEFRTTTTDKETNISYQPRLVHIGQKCLCPWCFLMQTSQLLKKPIWSIFICIVFTFFEKFLSAFEFITYKIHCLFVLRPYFLFQALSPNVENFKCSSSEVWKGDSVMSYLFVLWKTRVIFLLVDDFLVFFKNTLAFIMPFHHP